VADAWLIILAALGAGVILGNMAGARNARGAAWGLLIAGALLGPIFPTLVAILFHFIPAEQWGTAFGAMFSIGSLGGLLLPPIMGVYAGQRGIRTSWRVPIFLAFLISLVAIGLVLEWGFSS
jgi:fucose permease